MEYYVALKLHQSFDSSLHVTITFAGECTDEKVENMKNDAKRLAKLILPLIIDHDNEIESFGIDENIKVLKYEVENKMKWDAIKKFYSQYADRTDKFFDAERGPNLHISLKTFEKELISNKQLIISNLYIKQLGNDNLILECLF